MRLITRNSIFPVLCIFAILHCQVVNAQTKNPKKELLVLSLDELMDIEVEVASKEKTEIRRAPGIVTVVTREDIFSSGARDLIDVLRLIPGVQFGVDVQGVVGVGLRGLWAHEGKVLLLWNGHEMNDLLFSTTQFGNHFPISAIERIEIIRGPGSALYGGFAELGVINIVTRKGEELDGGTVSATAGRTHSSLGRSNITGQFGGKEGDLEYTFTGFVGDARRSDYSFTDFYGDTYSLEDNHELKPTLFGIDVSYEDLKASYLFDRYRTVQRDEFDLNLQSAARTHFESHNFSLEQGIRVTDNFIITPQIDFKRQAPWREYLNESEDNTVFHKTVERTTVGLTGSIDSPGMGLTTQFGVEYYSDVARGKLEDSPFYDDTYRLQYGDLSVFGQLMFGGEWGDITLGGRYDDHEQYDPEFVPRASYTYSTNNWHAKLLASKAFRTPSIENINTNQNVMLSEVPGVDELVPEETRVFEIETGVRLSQSTYLTTNVFDSRISDPIVYFFDSDTEQEGYKNLNRLGTQGLEAELRWLEDWGNVHFTYSYYQGKHIDADTYEVPGHSRDLLGFSRHVISARSTVLISDEWSVTPSLSLQGKRYGYETSDEAEAEVLERFDPSLLTNLSVGYSPQAIEALRISFSIYNLFNERSVFIQPYNNFHAPLPELSREYLLRVDFAF